MSQAKEIAAQKGHDVTEQEITAVVQDQELLAMTEDGHLSEKELETVTGGKGKSRGGKKGSGSKKGSDSKSTSYGLKCEITKTELN